MKKVNKTGYASEADFKKCKKLREMRFFEKSLIQKVEILNPLLEKHEVELIVMEELRILVASLNDKKLVNLWFKTNLLSVSKATALIALQGVEKEPKKFSNKELINFCLEEIPS